MIAPRVSERKGGDDGQYRGIKSVCGLRARLFSARFGPGIIICALGSRRHGTRLQSAKFNRSSFGKNKRLSLPIDARWSLSITPDHMGPAG